MALSKFSIENIKKGVAKNSGINFENFGGL